MKVIFIFFVKAYQKLLSPFLGNNCRFHPSCSSYALQCFDNFPIYKALWYSCKRISKCHPYHSGGFDPIPSRDH